jgi:hypothetical protein
MCYAWCWVALLFHRELRDYGLKRHNFRQTADIFTAAGFQPEAPTSQNLHAPVNVFSPVSDVEIQTLLLIKNRPRDWRKERLCPLRLNENWSFKLECLFLIYLSYSLSDNLQPLVSLNVPQTVGTDFELYSRKWQGTVYYTSIIPREADYSHGKFACRSLDTQLQKLLQQYITGLTLATMSL